MTGKKNKARRCSRQTKNRSEARKLATRRATKPTRRNSDEGERKSKDNTGGHRRTERVVEASAGAGGLKTQRERPHRKLKEKWKI